MVSTRRYWCCQVLLVPYTPIRVTGKVWDEASGIIEVAAFSSFSPFRCRRHSHRLPPPATST
jgi:hypothetical protein